MKVIWSPNAERHIDEIWEYIAADNVDAADRLAERLRTAANVLAEYPHIGRAGRKTRTRELVVAGTSYILVYRAARMQVEIVRVLHGARRYP